MKRISSWHLSRLRAAYRRTGSVPEAAKAGCVSVATAYRHLANEHLSRVPTFKTRIRREALKLYASGLSSRAVVRELEKSYSPAPSQESICQWAKAAGILRSKTRANELRAKRVHQKDYDRIRQIARQLSDERQLSPMHIARVLGVQKSVIRRAIARDQRLDPSEATLRRKWQADLPDVNERLHKRETVITMRERGATYPQIIAATGLSQSTVSIYLRSAGLTKAIPRAEVSP